MKIRQNLGTIIITFFIIAVIVVTVLLSLDLCGVISLPEKISLKTYFPSVVQTIGATDEEVYYPDYEATGTTVKIEETVQGESGAELSDFINSNNTNSNSDNYSNNQSYNVTDNSYFYNQLDVNGKTIYSKMYDSLDELKTGTATIDFGTTFNDLLQSADGERLITDAFQLSINALLLDHPEIFYLDVTKLYMYTESTKNISGTTYRVSIGPDDGKSYLSEGFYSESDVIIAESQIEEELNNIIDGLSGNTYNKVKQVHDYLIDNVTYDSDSNLDMSHSIYGALINNLAVCDGYAKAYKYILDNIGISCVEVCGVAQNSNGEIENHAWNDVLIDGTWYAVDVTWDDPIIVGGRGILTEELRYANFLKGSSTFYLSHQEDGYVVSNGEFKYPTLSESDY